MVDAKGRSSWRLPTLRYRGVAHLQGRSVRPLLTHDRFCVRRVTHRGGRNGASHVRWARIPHACPGPSHTFPKSAGFRHRSSTEALHELRQRNIAFVTAPTATRARSHACGGDLVGVRLFPPTVEGALREHAVATLVAAPRTQVTVIAQTQDPPGKQPSPASRPLHEQRSGGSPTLRRRLRGEQRTLLVVAPEPAGHAALPSWPITRPLPTSLFRSWFTTTPGAVSAPSELPGPAPRLQGAVRR